MIFTKVTMIFSALSLELERKHGKLYTGVCRQVGQSPTSIIFVFVSIFCVIICIFSKFKFKKGCGQDRFEGSWQDIGVQPS